MILSNAEKNGKEGGFPGARACPYQDLLLLIDREILTPDL